MTKTREAAEAALDVMLTDAAEGRSRFVRPGAAVNLAAGLARRPDRAARRAGHLGAELARVAAGRSDAAPGQARPPLRRSCLAVELAVPPAAAGLPGRRRRRRRR